MSALKEKVSFLKDWRDKRAQNMRERAPHPQDEPSRQPTEVPEDFGVPVASDQFKNGVILVGRLFLAVLHTIWKVIFTTVRTAWYYITRHPLHAVFNCVVFGVLTVLVLTGSDIHEQMLLSQISDQTVDRIIDASRFTRDFTLPNAKTRGAREFLRVGAPEWAQRESVRAVLFHARKMGLSVEHQAVLLATVEVESGFNATAKAATTTACGLFQFVERTGKIYGLAPADCMNPWLNAEAGVRHYKDNYENRVQERVAHMEGPERVFQIFEETYYLHHDGPRSSNPSNDVKATVLSGTQFLLRAYETLLAERNSKRYAPSFGERFQENMWDVLHSIQQMFRSSGAVSVSQSDAIQKPITAENTSIS